MLARMVVRGLPPVPELTRLGVRRVSAGSALAQTAYGAARRASHQFLREGRYEAAFEVAIDYGDMNGLFGVDG